MNQFALYFYQPIMRLNKGMKNFHTLILFFSWFISFGQTQTDGVNDAEIERILRNYRDHNITDFYLTSKTSYKNKKLWKEKFHFVFENDSIFQTHWRSDFSRYLLNEKDVYYIYSKQDSVNLNNYYHIIKFDSLGVKINLRYYIHAHDTLLTSRSSFSVDTITGSKTFIYTAYKDNKELRTNKHETAISADTIFEVGYTLLNNEWLIDSELKTYSEIVQKPEVEIIITTTIGRNYHRTPNLKPVNDFKRVEINTIYYSTSGLIKYIEIKELDYSRNEIHENVELILPRKKNKLPITKLPD